MSFKADFITISACWYALKSKKRSGVRITDLASSTPSIILSENLSPIDRTSRCDFSLIESEPCPFKDC